MSEGQAWELVQIQLKPSDQGKGLGTTILRLLISEAREANASLRLSVLRASPARHLYERLGFVVVAEKLRSYEMVLEV
ncbi:MAG: GNAT family N-acetyltransferase [Verrucomicrobiaceae bacterium]|nr:MAG: GNAT family N-acetyltransferase [Verrucomicrobiaceae bacterium]